MIERRPIANFFSHAVLILGVAIVAFPLYLAFVASTQSQEQIAASNPLSLIPGTNFLQTYRTAL